MSEEIKNAAVQEEAQDRVFPISAFVACLKGEAVDQGALEILSFITQSAVDAELAPVAAGLSKGFIYEQEPGLTKYSTAEVAKLGAKVKLTPLTGAELAQAQAVLGKLAELRAENASLKEALAKAEAAKAEIAGKVKGLEAKVKVYDDASAAGEKKVTMAAGKIDDMIKKLDDLQKEVEKVKSQGVVVAGAAGAAADGGEAAASGDSSDAPATGGEPEADFGFGSNPFADNSW